MYYVDNISMFYNADDIKSFVISRFEVKLRRRRSEDGDDFVNRKAFRSCVNAADRRLLLDSCKWPDSVMIY